MTNSLPLFEAKAHLSDLVRRIADDGNEVLITVRGKPMVKIVPVNARLKESAWEVRERVVHEYGYPAFEVPPRTTEVAIDPFSEDLHEVEICNEDSGHNRTPGPGKHSANLVP